ncbi:hypothetical protein, partial [Kribbella jejuensis]|uniref:hypothetical protein n=1 Tax=Kribbella jejuensis TaxID=236068 RepID=UPI0031D55E97
VTPPPSPRRRHPAAVTPPPSPRRRHPAAVTPSRHPQPPRLPLDNSRIDGQLDYRLAHPQADATAHLALLTQLLTTPTPPRPVRWPDV